MTTFHIISIFPEVFEAYLNESVLNRGQLKKKIKFKFYNPRDFVKSKHKKVDMPPFGGGPGMVMMAEPILKAWQKALSSSKKKVVSSKVKTILLTPSGKQFNNKYAKRVSKNYTDIILIAGRYEGIDARVKKITKAEEISVGPYVLTGGELPAMIVIDAISRQIPGVLGNEFSVEEKRVSTSEVYTRPEVLKYRGKSYKVPKVLLSGHHKKIEEWKKRRA